MGIDQQSMADVVISVRLMCIFGRHGHVVGGVLSIDSVVIFANLMEDVAVILFVYFSLCMSV